MTAGLYNLTPERLMQMTTNGAPHGRSDHTAVWTGSEMLIWGGYYQVSTWVHTWPGGGDVFRTNFFCSDGARYNPAANTWVAISNTNAPAGRSLHTAVWTGKEMIVWGGYNTGNDGGRYNPRWILGRLSPATARPRAGAFTLPCGPERR